MIALAVDSTLAEKLKNPIKFCALTGEGKDIVSDFVFAISYAFGALAQNDSEMAENFKEVLIGCLVGNKGENPVWTAGLYESIADGAKERGSTLINETLTIDKNELKKQMQELLNNEGE